MAQPILFPTPRAAAVYPTHSVETVDPDTAKQWLGTNTRNRGLKRGALATYVYAMRNGQWQFTGEAIKFAVDGSLLDGQHRLTAIVQAGVTLPMLVIRNLDPDAQDVMDSGAGRTPYDALHIDGEKRASLIQAVARMIIGNGEDLTRRVSTPEVKEVLSAEPIIRWIINEVVPDLRITVVTDSILAYAYWRLQKIDAAAAHGFFQALSSLSGLPEGSPILALHKRLADPKVASRTGRQYRREALALIFSAWNAWRRGESRSLIKLGYTDGRLNVPEPK